MYCYVFLCVRYNLKTTFICRHICILFISYKVTVVSNTSH